MGRKKHLPDPNNVTPAPEMAFVGCPVSQHPAARNAPAEPLRFRPIAREKALLFRGRRGAGKPGERKKPFGCRATKLYRAQKAKTADFVSAAVFKKSAATAGTQTPDSKKSAVGLVFKPNFIKNQFVMVSSVSLSKM